MSGGLAGGQVGCDWQFSGNWVLGIETKWSASDITGTNQDQFNNTNWTLRDRVDWFGTVTGRLGWTANNVLVYGRGGVAWAHNNFEIDETFGRGSGSVGSPSTTRTGWTVGAGVECAFAPSWSVFLEGDFYGFNGIDVGFSGLPLVQAPFGVHTGQNAEALQFGINYRFFPR
jgi:outer membrane immunogenic protein